MLIWRGISELDGVTPIVLILTGVSGAKSRNAKTGDMVQSYILVDETRPADAIRSGADAAICGACPHRRQEDGSRSCYVNLATGLNTVGRIMVDGNYPEVAPEAAAEMIEGRVLRLGTYGDPAAVPLHVWQALLAKVAGWTGYTHQWRGDKVQGFRSILMASVDSESDRAAAKVLGWRTFRVRKAIPAIEPMGEREIVCPASEEGGRKVTCTNCQLCKGTSSAAKDIAIIDHSPRATAARKRLTVLA